MTEKTHTAETVAETDAAYDWLVYRIAQDLEASIANIGHPVGCGIAPSNSVCRRAAKKIIASVGDRALELLAERKAQDPKATGGDR